MIHVQYASTVPLMFTLAVNHALLQYQISTPVLTFSFDGTVTVAKNMELSKKPCYILYGWWYTKVPPTWLVITGALVVQVRWACMAWCMP